jgi:N-acetylglutamate synthase-like GNAT family acetyltransferase
MNALPRPARPGELPAILDLLAEYGLPSSWFDARYTPDPSFRIEQSWVVEEHGQLVAHLHFYHRTLYLGPARLPIAGLGNVITHPAHRHQGHAARLLTAALGAAQATSAAYSLLWTHIPELYARHGYGAIREDQLALQLPAETCHISEAFTDANLPAVAALYERNNAGRSGPTVRTPAYWKAQRHWLQEKPDDFRVHRRDGDAEITGYVRRRLDAADGNVTIVELGVAPATEPGLATALAVDAGAGETNVEAVLPPSLQSSVSAIATGMHPRAGLMGRPLNLRVLAGVLQRLWPGIAAEVTITHHPGVVTFRADGNRVTVRAEPTGREPLSPAEFGHLLLRGYDTPAARALAHRDDAEILARLFPAQDFVIWPTDEF